MFSRLTLTCAYHRSTRPSTLWRSLTLSKRSTSSTFHTDETISIPVGGNGTVDLKISRPSQPAKNNNVLVYLPPGPFLESSRRDSQIFDSRNLRDSFPDTTVVDLEYRISLRNNTTSTRSPKPPRPRNDDKEKPAETQPAPDHRLPTPIHDVFAAWDYITDSLQLYNHDTVDGKNIYFRPRISLVGSHIGGALALSLALTNPNAISAVAVVDCLGDWTGLDELIGERDGEVEKKEGKKRGNIRRDKERISERERVRLAAKELLRLRGRLFRSHSGYFDAFASPVLFLRAPGRDTPVENGDVGIGIGIGIGGGEKGVVMRYREEVDEVGVIVDDTHSDIGVGVDVSVDVGQAFGPYDDDWQARGYDEIHGDGLIRDGKSEGVIGVPDTSSTNGGATEVQPESSATTVSDMSSTTGTSPASLTSTDQDSTGTSTTPPQSLTTPIQSTPETPASPASTSSSPSPSPPPPPPSPPRRRKVLRRWPPTAHPEDVLLPYINLYTTSSPSPLLPPSPPISLTSMSTTSTTPNSPDPDYPQPIDTTPVTNLQAQELQELLRKACFWGREKSFAEERVVMTRLGEGDDGVDFGVGREERDREREREREQVVKWLQMRFDEEV